MVVRGVGADGGEICPIFIIKGMRHRIRTK